MDSRRFSAGGVPPPESPVAGTPLWRTVTVRRFLLAAVLMLPVIGLFQFVGWLEPGVARHERIVERAATEAAMRFTGIAHFLIAFMFMASSTRMRSAAGLRRIGVGLGLGALLSGLFWWSGAPQTYAPIPVALFYAFFMAHELRDEAFFYQANGEAPQNLGGRSPLATGFALSLALILLTLTFFWSSPFFSERNSRFLTWLIDIPSLSTIEWTFFWIAPMLMFVGGAYLCVRWMARAAGTSAMGFLRLHRPLAAVYLGVAIVLALGFGTLYNIILLHVMVWWVFISAGLSRNGLTGGPRELGLWNWFRKTQTGFQTLHVSLALLALATGAVWVYGYDKSTDHFLSLLVQRESFFYWTIMHISLSFIPKP